MPAGMSGFSALRFIFMYQTQYHHTNYYRGDIMDNKQKKDPYNFDITKDGLEKRFRVILSERNAYKLKEKQKNK